MKHTKEAFTPIYYWVSWRSKTRTRAIRTRRKLKKNLYRIRRKRPSLRLIVSSATLDATSFLEYFTAGNSQDEATIVSLEGRMFPVDVAYLQEPVADYVRKAAQVAYDINLRVCVDPFHTCTQLTQGCYSKALETSSSFWQVEKISNDAWMNYLNSFRGMYLVCLPCLMFNPSILSIPKGSTRLIPMGLHAGLSTDEQLRVFEPAERGTRKVIISTNIAEVRKFDTTAHNRKSIFVLGQCDYWRYQIRSGFWLCILKEE